MEYGEGEWVFVSLRDPYRLINSDRGRLYTVQDSLTSTLSFPRFSESYHLNFHIRTWPERTMFMCAFERYRQLYLCVQIDKLIIMCTLYKKGRAVQTHAHISAHQFPRINKRTCQCRTW